MCYDADTVMLEVKLQALVYDILRKEVPKKRCSECGLKPVFCVDNVHEGTPWSGQLLCVCTHVEEWRILAAFK